MNPARTIFHGIQHEIKTTSSRSTTAFIYSKIKCYRCVFLILKLHLSRFTNTDHGNSAYLQNGN